MSEEKSNENEILSKEDNSETPSNADELGYVLYTLFYCKA